MGKPGFRKPSIQATLLEEAYFVTPADLLDRCANARRIEAVIE